MARQVAYLKKDESCACPHGGTRHVGQSVGMGNGTVKRKLGGIRAKEVARTASIHWFRTPRQLGNFLLKPYRIESPALYGSGCSNPAEIACSHSVNIREDSHDCCSIELEGWGWEDHNSP